MGFDESRMASEIIVCPGRFIFGRMTSAPWPEKPACCGCYPGLCESRTFLS